MANGYDDKSNYPAADQANLWVVFSAGGLYSTVEDFYRWDQALYTGKLVPQKVLDAVFATYITMPDSIVPLGVPASMVGWGYDYGWMIAPAGQQRIIGHGGALYGFTSLIKRYPDDRATIIIMTNQGDVAPFDMCDLVATKLFGK